MSQPLPTTSDTTVYTARSVHTFDPARATASAVAVRDGRFLAVGDPNDLVATYDGSLDRTLEDKVLMPGFVEAHCHKDTGGLWQYTYVGYEGRTDPDGRFWSGCTTFDAVVERLREADRTLADPDEPLLAWGLDPIFWPG